jgi:hypothetical protein
MLRLPRSGVATAAALRRIAVTSISCHRVIVAA